MMKHFFRKKEHLPLLIAAAVAIGFALLVNMLGKTDTLSIYQEQVYAANQMQLASKAIKQYKEELGIPIDVEDWHETGLIGEPFNGLTTTLGNVSAKRSSTMPDMAALLVRLFYELDITEGSTIGAGFSGSFPGLNLATLCAADQVGAKIVYIASIGSSMYGANNLELSFPEIAWNLYQDGYISTPPQFVSVGGDADIGLEMDQTILASVMKRLTTTPVNIFIEPNYKENVEKRMSVYEANGPIDVFVSVGGHTTSLGLNENGATIGEGILLPRDAPIKDNSGLVERYLAKGTPVIQLINIKKLFLDYGLQFDPTVLPAIGTSPVYRRVTYPAGVSLIGILLIIVLISISARARYQARRSVHQQRDSASNAD